MMLPDQNEGLEVGSGLCDGLGRRVRTSKTSEAPVAAEGRERKGASLNGNRNPKGRREIDS